eukprot:145768-Rhodomonas_salina.1
MASKARGMLRLTSCSLSLRSDSSYMDTSVENASLWGSRGRAHPPPSHQQFSGFANDRRPSITTSPLLRSQRTVMSIGSDASHMDTSTDGASLFSSQQAMPSPRHSSLGGRPSYRHLRRMSRAYEDEASVEMPVHGYGGSAPSIAQGYVLSSVADA